MIIARFSYPKVAFLFLIFSLALALLLFRVFEPTAGMPWASTLLSRQKWLDPETWLALAICGFFIGSMIWLVRQFHSQGSRAIWVEDGVLKYPTMRWLSGFESVPLKDLEMAKRGWAGFNYPLPGVVLYDKAGQRLGMKSVLLSETRDVIIARLNEIIANPERAAQPGAPGP